MNEIDHYNKENIDITSEIYLQSKVLSHRYNFVYAIFFIGHFVLCNNFVDHAITVNVYYRYEKIFLLFLIVT